MDKIVFFLLKKKIKTVAGEMDAVSKTKVFMLIEGISRLIETVSPYFGYQISFPPSVHGFLYAMAGIAYREAINDKVVVQTPLNDQATINKK